MHKYYCKSSVLTGWEDETLIHHGLVVVASQLGAAKCIVHHAVTPIDIISHSNRSNASKEQSKGVKYKPLRARLFVVKEWFHSTYIHEVYGQSLSTLCNNRETASSGRFQLLLRSK